jgi:hypothetical protein
MSIVFMNLSLRESDTQKHGKNGFIHLFKKLDIIILHLTNLSPILNLIHISNLVMTPCSSSAGSL